MQLIKKYANRKLYHTNQKQYITLEGIARLVQEGEAVQILDNETGNDITSSILAQVVLQSRGRSAPQLPTQLLTGLIQIGGDTISTLRRNLATTLAGIEVLEAELDRRFDHLVSIKAITPEEATRWHRLLTQTDFGPSSPTFEQAVADVPSRNDVVKLHNQVDALAQIVQQILEDRSTPNGK